MERVCTNCRHYSQEYSIGTHGELQFDSMCRALDGHQNPVRGGAISVISADLMRMTLCGWNDPKLFEPNPPVSARAESRRS